VQGRTTLSYLKPFKQCVGADGDTYRTVLHWHGKGAVSSSNAFLNGQKIRNDVDFFQNVKTGAGVVYGTVETSRTVGGPATASGTMQVVWDGANGTGQIVLHARAAPAAGGVFVFNALFHIRPPSGKRIDVDIVFGTRSTYDAVERQRVHQRRGVRLAEECKLDRTTDTASGSS
jgi:hypothetical protein